MNLFLVIGLALLGTCVCQTNPIVVASTVKPTGHHHHHNTTHHPHGTKAPHEPTEHEGFLFHYTPTTHKMYVRMGHRCYIADLTADERVKVHTDVGIRELEVKLLQMLSIATNVTGQNVDSKSTHICGHNSRQFFTIP